MHQPQKITAHMLKRIEKTLTKMNAPMGAFELFFTFLGFIATEERFQPADIVKVLLKMPNFTPIMKHTRVLIRYFHLAMILSLCLRS